MAFRILWSKISVAFEGNGLWWLTSYPTISLVGHYRGWFEIGIDFHTGTDFTLIARAIFLDATIFAVANTFPKISETTLQRQDLSYGICLWHMLVVTTCLALGLTELLPV